MAEQIGSLFKSSLPNGGSAQLVAPAANVNGLVLRTATITAGNAWSILSTGTTAPTSDIDVTRPVILACRGAAAANTGAGASATLPFQITIPAGYGLWLASSGSFNGAYITYDLL